VAANFNYSADSFTMSVDGTPLIEKPMSSFKGYPLASIRPDVLYVGSLALLEEAVSWTDIELDWLRVYSRDSTPAAQYGLLAAAIEPSPTPLDPATPYSTMLPAGPFANAPHWVEDFDSAGLMPAGWHQVAIRIRPIPGRWWPESDCSLNWYLRGENTTAPEVLFFGNPATAREFPSSWSEVHVDWFATFPGLPRVPLLPTTAAAAEPRP
jgi:hypothetical protein